MIDLFFGFFVGMVVSFEVVYWYLRIRKIDIFLFREKK
jgi:hypothetical protein